ncbi:type IV secretion system protein VirB10 [Microvirgula aerodenitrificans]|uniref:type IV secretion system protein VirB10 n=1 Tax=Microvirgula aerodenitrificans TaxID=57480 RepID=UPI00248EA10E|nr:type IV secretion system protein VirB10 [Microvirgula aerodenitrificans]
MSAQQNSEVVNSLPGEERGMPSVNDDGPSTAKRGLVFVALLLVVGAGAGVGYWKYQKNAAKANQVSEQKDLQLTSAVPARTFIEPPQEAPPLPGATPVVPAPAGTTTDGTATAAAGGLGQPAMPVDAGKPVPTLDKSGSTLMSGNNSNTPTTTAGGGSDAPAGGSDGQLGAGGSMAEMLSATSTPMRKAGKLGNRNFILAKGSAIDCALQTMLDSTVPGMTSCTVTRNIFSDNGKVLLIERGSTASGEYKSNMRQGMARIGVLWSRIKTPKGIVINLDSPGSDPLGGAGVPGYVDNHFWQRFGGALMLSLIDDVARGATSNSGSNGQFNLNSTGDAAQNMATEALKNTINIPPTLYKNQGEQVGIYVARDLDFSSVYDVK